MEKGDSSSMGEKETEETTTTTTTRHHRTIPPGLSREEFEELKPIINEFHTYSMCSGQCSSLLAQRTLAPVDTLWSVVRRFDKPQTYKHFIKSCSLKEGSDMAVGCLRYVNVISGLPAETSTERLDILDDERHVMGFSIIGGEHRLRNYRSVTTVSEFAGAGERKMWTVVLESYVVDVPEGNTEEDTRMFADTVVRLNLQKLASVSEGLARDEDRKTRVEYLLKSVMDFGVGKMELSALQKHRSLYVPELPPCLQGSIVQVEFGEATAVPDISDAQSVRRSFPHTYGKPLVHFLTPSSSVRDAHVIKEPLTRYIMPHCFHFHTYAFERKEEN
ncbi:hypothetical protein HHK36_028510 [Tetracentron sinense]|uniref:Uncharacterized protein n=1 Tax=Tetracentron sinense TaxID=13715 RepID=A0A834YFV7_TETSI|nr:hypothetical protein HHK36_028510 [Tetracentron sinense]